jgi:uncharacterized membrane protein YphA (DoxX/SURF4 family)
MTHAITIVLYALSFTSTVLVVVGFKTFVAPWPLLVVLPIIWLREQRKRENSQNQ